jgi:hypothetical protein
MMAVTDVVSRPVRAVPQGGAAWLIVEAVEAFNIYDFTDRQYGLAIVILTPVVAWAQVLIENRFGKGFLRKPEPPAKPIEVVEG